MEKPMSRRSELNENREIGEYLAGNVVFGRDKD
jgi:hypothetical protein